MLLLFPHPLSVTRIRVVGWLRIAAGNCMVPITVGKEGNRKGVCRKLGLVAWVHPQSAPQCDDPSDGCWCGVRTRGHASFPCPCLDVTASAVAVSISRWFCLKRKGDACKKGFLELGQKNHSVFFHSGWKKILAVAAWSILEISENECVSQVLQTAFIQQILTLRVCRSQYLGPN